MISAGNNDVRLCTTMYLLIRKYTALNYVFDHGFGLVHRIKWISWIHIALALIHVGSQMIGRTLINKINWVLM